MPISRKGDGSLPKAKDNYGAAKEAKPARKQRDFNEKKKAT